jgi:serine protease Do
MNVRRYVVIALGVVACVMPAFGQSQPARTKALEELSGSFEALSTRVSAACVAIESVGYAPLEAENATAATLLTRQRLTGSGFVIDPNGYIITNAHVVRGARRIRVALGVPADIGTPPKSIVKPQGRLLDARLVGTDSETDLAVLKINETKLPVLPLADSDDLHQGQIVFAFGSPFGLQNSVTVGIISAVARQRTLDDPMVYVQTDAPINPGNSGGPLVDTSGRVIGVNTFIYSASGGNEGVGFAAPSNIVKHVFEEIRQRGRVRRGAVGLGAQSITPTLAVGLGLTHAWGVIVGDVFPQGPADRAGVKIGDVILTLDGKVMENGRQFDVNVYRHSPGDKITLELNRSGKTERVTVSVAERAGDPERFMDMVRADRNLISRLGILAVDIDGQVEQMLSGLRRPGGVLVAARAVDAASSESGLLAGDIILGVNGEPVTNLAALRRVITAFNPGAACVLQIQRGGRLMFVAFEIED